MGLVRLRGIGEEGRRPVGKSTKTQAGQEDTGDRRGPKTGNHYRNQPSRAVEKEPCPPPKVGHEEEDEPE